MRKRAKKFSVAAAALGGALALGGCGTPSSSHVALGTPPAHVATATAPSTAANKVSATTGRSGSGGGAAVGGETTARSTSTTSRAATATTTTTSPASNPAGGAPASQSPAPAPASPVNQQTLNEVAGELGALGQSLSQATSDLDNPQGDS